MTDRTTKAKVLKDLGPEAKEFAEQLLATFDFTQDPHRLMLVRQCALQLQLICRLQGMIEARDDLTVLGAAKQPVLAGEVSEIRAARVALVTMVRGLGLPDTPAMAEQKASELSLVRSANRKGIKARAVSY
jgi:hypothetical protein